MVVREVAAGGRPASPLRPGASEVEEDLGRTAVRSIDVTRNEAEFLVERQGRFIRSCAGTKGVT